MNTLKKFDRFPHSGVKRHLVQLKNTLGLDVNGLEFGSSGEGELTIRSAEATAYARKYKNQDGWKVVLCKGMKEVDVVYPSEFNSAVSQVRGWVS